jgi:hypothetical protein
MPVVFLTAAWLAAGGPADRPPPLTFEKPVDYVAWYNEFVSKGKKDNAYPFYSGLSPDEKGRGGFPNVDGAAAEQLDKALKQVWTADEFPELAAYLKNCAPYFETFEQAVKHSDYWQPAPPDTELLGKLMLPSLSGGRAGCKAILAQALMKQDDQPKAVMNACAVVLQNADHMQQPGMLVGALVGIAERVLVYRVARTTLANGVIEGSDIALLYATIHRRDPGFPDAMRWVTLECEWAMPLEALQHICPKGEFDADRWRSVLTASGQPEGGQKTPSPPFDPKETARLIDAHFEGLRSTIAGPPSLIAARKAEEFEKEQHAKLMGNSFTARLMPSFARAYHLQLRAEASHRATLLCLAIHAHHAKHGQWPASLKKIDKKLGLKGLKESRIDPYSGKDFIYKIKNGQPLLYSVASNGKDDGGRHDKKWGESETDSDYVFWPPQE